MAPLETAADAVAWLRTPQAIRARAGLILAAAERDDLSHFALDPGRLGPAADYVIGVIRANYPILAIPYHSRWRHFAAGGRDRCAALVAASAGRARAPALRSGGDERAARRRRGRCLALRRARKWHRARPLRGPRDREPRSVHERHALVRSRPAAARRRQGAAAARRAAPRRGLPGQRGQSAGRPRRPRRAAQPAGPRGRRQARAVRRNDAAGRRAVRPPRLPGGGRAAARRPRSSRRCSRASARSGPGGSSSAASTSATSAAIPPPRATI